jgi:hypothetical protein
MLLLYKNMLDRKQCQAPITPKILRQSEALEVDRMVFDSSSVKDLWVEARQQHEELWKCKKMERHYAMNGFRILLKIGHVQQETRNGSLSSAKWLEPLKKMR